MRGTARQQAAGGTHPWVVSGLSSSSCWSDMEDRMEKQRLWQSAQVSWAEGGVEGGALGRWA